MANTFAWNAAYLATFPGAQFGYGSDAALSMNASGIAFGCIFQVPEDLTLTHGNVIIRGITGTPPAYKLQVWPMSTSADNTPDTSGTVLAETAEFTPDTYVYPGTLEKIAFESSYAASGGDVLCIICVYSSGTVDGSNYAKFTRNKGRVDGISGAPSVLARTTTTWSSANVYYPSTYITTDKDYDIGGTPTLTTSTFSLADNDIGALKIVMPDAIDGNGIKLFCKGFKYAGTGPNGEDEFTCGVWNAAGVALIESPTIVAEKGGGGTAGSWGYNLGIGDLLFGDVIELESGNTYYMGIKQAAGSTTIQMAGCWFRGENDMFRAWPGGDMLKASVWDSSAGSPAWDDDGFGSFGEGRFLISPLLSDIQGTSSGGGGSTTRPTMGVIG